MLCSVLRSQQAGQVNAKIMRTFVRLRRILTENAELAAKLDHLEERYAEQFKVVFDAIRELMRPEESSRRPIGFIWDDQEQEPGQP